MTKQATIYESGLYFVLVSSAPTVIWLFFHNHLVVFIFFSSSLNLIAFSTADEPFFFHFKIIISPIAYKCTYTVFIIIFFPRTFITWSFSLFLFTLLCLWLRSWLLKHQDVFHVWFNINFVLSVQSMRAITMSHFTVDIYCFNYMQKIHFSG